MVKQWRSIRLILAVIFLLLFGWNQLTASRHPLPIHPLVHSFQSNDLQADKWVIHHGAPLDQPLTDGQMKRLIRYFQLTERQQPSFPHTPNSKQSEQHYVSDWWRNIPVEIRVIRRGREKNGIVDHYLVVNVKARKRNVQALADTADHVSEGLRQAGITPNMQVAIQGTAPVVLGPNEKQRLIDRLLEDLDAYEVEALRDSTSTSVSAFSPQAGKPIVSGGREMNVQIAARTDRVLRQTVITMGTPIITIEY